MDNSAMQRTQLLLGTDSVSRISQARVIIFGVGGVGSWCAESLVRSGICNLAIVDSDTVSATNCNRQLMATSRTVGQIKVEALRDRLLEINPNASITAIQAVYTPESSESFHIEDYDYVIDCIDSLKDKCDLILKATKLMSEKRLVFFSSMGAALKIDPTQVRKGEFYDVKGDPFARAIRKKFKHMGIFPHCRFQCVYSLEEPLENRGETDPDDTCSYKAKINGSLCHVTGIFGFFLAGMVLQDLVK